MTVLARVSRLLRRRQPPLAEPAPTLSPMLALAAVIERWDCPKEVHRSIALGLDVNRVNVALRTDGIDVMADIPVDANEARVKVELDYLLFRLMVWRDRLALPPIDLNLPEIRLTAGVGFGLGGGEI